MAESYSVEAVLSAVDRNYSSTMKSAISAAESLGKTLTITGAAITAMGMSSLKSFGSFQSSLNKAAVTAGGTAKDIDGLADVANHMGAVLPISAQDAADAMVQMAQAGANVGTIKKEFPAIAEAATATGADLQATATTVQNAMNIWGDSLKSPQRAAAILTDTANLSNASIEDMSSALANVGGAAHMMGMSMQDTSTAIGLLTNRGFSAAQASQDLNHAILAMQAPSKVAANQMSALGLSFTDAQGNMKPFPTILADVNKALDGLKPNQRAAALKKLFGTAGMGAIAPLLDSVANKTNDTSKSWDAFSATVQKDSKDAATATKYLSDQAAEMQKNIGSKVEQVGGNWEALRNTAMSSTSAINGALLDMINNVLEWATTSKSGIAEFTRGFIGLMPVIGPAVIALGGFLTAVTKIGAVLSGIGTALVNPWILAAAAVAALVAVFAKAYSSSTQLQDAVKLIGDVFSTVFGPVIDAAKKSMSGLSGTIDKVAESIGNTLATALVSVNWTSFFEGAKAALDGVISIVRTIISGIGKMVSAFVEAGGAAATWSAIVTIAQTVWTVISTIGRVLAEVIAKMVSLGATSSIFEIMGTGLASIAKGLNAIAPIIGTVVAAFMIFKTIVSVINGVLAVVGVLSKAFSALGTIASVVGALLSTPWVAAAAAVAVLVAAVIVAYNKFAWFRDFVNSIPGTLQAAWSAFTTWFAGIWTTVVATATTIWNTLVTVAQTVIAALEVAWTVIGPFFATLWQTIVTVATTIWDTLVTVFTTIVQMVMTVWNLIGPFFTTLWTGIVTVATAIWTGLSSIITALIPILEAAWALFGPFIIAIFTAIWTAAITIWNGISTVITTVMAVIQAVITTAMGVISALWSAAWGVISAVVSTIWNVIVAVVTTAINVVSGIITAVLDVISGNWSGAWNAIKGVASSIWNGIKSVISSVINGISGVISSVLSGIAGVWSSVWNGIKSVASSIWNAIKSVISSEINAARSIISSVMSGIASTMSNIWHSIVSVVSSTFSRVVSNVSNGISRAYQAVTGYVGRMASAGANFVKGFVRGITGAIGGAVQAAANMAKSALNAAKSALGIHSPSRVMKKEVGYYTAAGMAVGILDNLKLVTDAAKQLAGAAVPDTPTVDFEASYDASNLDNFMAGTKKLQSNLQAAVSSQVNYAEQKQFTVEVPVNLDGQEVARITAEPMESELAKRSQRTNRIYGRRS